MGTSFPKAVHSIHLAITKEEFSTIYLDILQNGKSNFNGQDVSLSPGFKKKGIDPLRIALVEFENGAIPMTVKKRSRTKLILINSPSNPHGWVASQQDIKGIVDAAIDHKLYVASDEIYESIIYEGKHISPLMSGKRDSGKSLDPERRSI